jgi:cytochrome c oxidase cbb3-type subunit 2
VPESNRPAYPWLERTPVDGESLGGRLRALSRVGVPYTAEEIADAGKAVDGRTELDALIAYMQVLGTSLKPAATPVATH